MIYRLLHLWERARKDARQWAGRLGRFCHWRKYDG